MEIIESIHNKCHLLVCRNWIIWDDEQDGCNDGTDQIPGDFHPLGELQEIQLSLVVGCDRLQCRWLQSRVP